MHRHTHVSVSGVQKTDSHVYVAGDGRSETQSGLAVQEDFLFSCQTQLVVLTCSSNNRAVGALWPAGLFRWDAFPSLTHTLTSVKFMYELSHPLSRGYQEVSVTEVDR